MQAISWHGHRAVALRAIACKQAPTLGPSTPEVTYFLGRSMPAARPVLPETDSPGVSDSKTIVAAVGNPKVFPVIVTFSLARK